MAHKEKIVILDFSRGEAFVCAISEKEETSTFLERRGFRENDIQWIRGNLNIYIEDEAKD